MIWILTPLVFSLVTVAIAFMGALGGGSLTLTLSWISLCGGMGAAALVCWVLRDRFKNYKLPSLEPLDLIMFFFFFLFSYRQGLWVYFEKGGSAYSINTNNLGDLPLHLTYIQNFVNGTSFWPKNPIFPAERLHYPFGIDLLTAIFVKVGVPLRNILPAMGFVGCGVTDLVLHLWGRGFTMGAFLFAGGLAGFEFFQTSIIKDYQAQLAWKSLPLSLLIPQRGFLIAFPLGLLLLWSWRRRFFNSHGPPLPKWLEGLLWGSLPLFHFHTFIFVSLIFGIWTLVQKKFKEALPVFLPAFVVATPETLLLLGGLGGSSVVSIKSGWMIGSQNPLWFFLYNYGLFVILALAALIIAYRKKDRENLTILMTGLGFYFVLLFVMLAPWDWDNTKVMVWCYLLVLPSMYDLFLRPMRVELRALWLVVLFFSGSLSLYNGYRETNTGVELFNLTEVGLICSALKETPPDAIYATNQTFNHPVALCGHRVVAGYSGHLWSHGINARETEAKLKRLMLGDPDWRKIAKELQVRYLFWGNRELMTFAESKAPWQTEAVSLAHGAWGTVYDLGDSP